MTKSKKKTDRTEEVYAVMKPVSIFEEILLNDQRLQEFLENPEKFKGLLTDEEISTLKNPELVKQALDTDKTIRMPQINLGDLFDEKSSKSPFGRICSNPAPSSYSSCKK
jgi:hypothetical protein